MSWHKSFDEYVNNQNNGQSSLNSGGNTTVTHNGKTYYTGNSNGSAFQSFVSSKNYPEDIAPVASRVTTRAKDKEEEKKKKRKWYEKGHFEDGWDFGDITKTILGIDEDTASLKDLTVGSVKRGYLNSIYGEESFKAMNGGQNKKDEYAQILAGDEYQFTPGNDAAGAVSGAMELLGQQFRQFTNPSTLALAGTAATMAGIAGQAGPQVLAPEEVITVPAAAMAGFTAGSAKSNLEIEAGHAYNEMLESGISEETAKKVATAVGAVNASLEILQVDELLDAYKVTKASGATKTFTKKILDELVDRGVDVAKETVQEVAQEGVTIAGTQYASQKDKGEYAYNSDDVKDRLKDTAKSSALSFGLMNAPAAVKNTVSIASEQHKANSLTKNEQAVVDKVVADRVAEAEKDGKKLSNSEKRKINESVVAEMEKGYIPVDTIEEVLGGEKYSQYKQAAEWEDSLQTEFDTLNKMKQGDMTGEQVDRREALRTQIQNVKATSTLAQQRTQIRDEVMGLVRGDRLAESYNERVRTGQKFEADVTKYDAKQQAVVQKAIDSGILNNSNRTHEFVDFVSKISADTGVLFDFSNTAKIREAGFAVEGQTVDGFITKDGITVNIDSPKSRQFVVGHEITHALEGTELYDALRKSVFDYAKMKNQYGVRMESIQKRYKEGTDYEAELTADLVGEYIFSDTDFIKNLSTQNRNVFQKVYDEIKYLCKVATAGSKEARELEKVKRAFEKAYREGGKAQGETKYSLDSDANSNPNVSEVDSYSDYGAGKSVFRNGWLNSNPKMLEAIVENRKQTETKEFASWFGNSKATNKSAEPLLVYHGTKSRFTEFNSDGKPIWFSPNVMYSRGGATQTSTGDKFLPSGKVFGGANERVIPAYIKAENPADFGNTSLLFEDVATDISQNLGIDEAALRNVWEQTGRNAELYKTVHSAEMVELLKQHGYDSITAIEDGSPTWAVFESNQAKSAVANKGSFNISDPDIRYSLSDSNGKQLTKEQQDFFKDSKVRDENGSLQVMYHGSPESFTVFDKKKAKSSGLYGKGFYFTNSDSHAKQYGNTYEVYLNITNPLQNGTNDITKDQLRSFVEAIAEDEDYGIENYGYEATVDSVTNNVFGKGDFAMLMDINVTCVGNMVEAIELFNKVNGTGYNGIIAPTETVAFYPEQIKEVANQKPTADKDIRFSLSDTVEETKDLMALHNLTSEKLMKSLKLGGLPMPSVAIAKAKDGHDEFGEISLILPKETIDPKESRNNKLYSGDAWTPTYPSVDYKPSEKVLKKVKDKISGLVPHEVRDVLGNLMFDTDNASDYLSRYNGNMVEAYKRNDAMKYAYLKDTGSDISLPMKEENLVRYGDVSNSAVRYFSGKLVNGLQTVELYQNMSARDLLQDKALTEAVADALNFDVLRTMEPGSPEYMEYERNPAFFADEVTFRDIDRLLSGCRKLFTNGVQQTVDRRAAKELIQDAVDQTAYENWLENLFAGVVEKEGIRNNKDYFTPAGNRRSFEALHYEHNLENVIKAMREKGEKGIGFGGGSIFGAATTEFSSVDEMKQASGRLQQMSEEEYQEIKDGFTKRFFDLASSLPKSKNSWTATDDAANTLTEAVAKYQTKRGIANYLRRELDGWANYSPQVVDDLIELVNDIRNMPTGYFEAKPQRAVSFEEVGVFVIPYDADVKLKQELLNKGYSIAEYDPKVEGDRQRVVNQFEEYKFSLSNVGEQHTPDSLSALRLQTAEESPVVAPVAENATVQQKTQLTEENSTLAPVTAEDMSALFPNNAVPVQKELEQLIYERDQIFSALEVAVDRGTANEVGKLAEEYEALNTRIKALESGDSERTGSLTDADVPPEMDAPFYGEESEQAAPDDPFYDRDISEVGKRSVNAYQFENPEVKPFFQEAALGMLYDVRNTTKGEKWYNDELYYATGGEQGFGGTKRQTTDDIAELKDVYGYTYDQIEAGLNAIIEDDGAENNAVSKRIEFMLNDRLLKGYTDIDGRSYEPNQGYIKLLNEKQITEYSKEAFDQFMANADQYAPSLEESYAPILNSDPRYEQTAPVYDLPGGQQTYVPTKATYDATPTDDIAPLFDATGKKGVPDGQQAFMPNAGEDVKQTRKEYHQSIIDNIKSIFRGEGFDFDKVLKDAKNLSTWSTVDNTPQRVMEKALGYKEGGILADITVNKVAQNETEGIKWLNSYVDQLKQISKQYGIKPGSKESAAAQMFAEGFFVNENNEIIRYGDPELIQDFGNADVRRRIKGLARDPRIRKIYDDTLANINASRARNLYPEIPRLDNYFLHFRAMEDTFSTLGLPFNPNDIRAKDLPTDLNGVTADLKPGQPYFASANHRTGKRTSFDLLGGVERYLNSAKNQIYHIDDIQTLRALRNYVAETYGQATGLEDIDSMTDAEAEERIKQVYDSHLSTFAKFLNEEANVLAGKTALIDRGIEGIIGRRGITFLNALNKQVGSNMVGYNVSSSLTNFLPVVQTFAKTNKFDFTKAFTQTVANKLTGGRFDSFAEDSPVVIRRKGEDRFYRTPWQKMADPGYALMGMVDDISTEIIARTKYNEFTRKGMDSQKAHFETDKWVSRLMGDRSLGQQPQLYNSKMLGLVTKFQLEVRNQLDSQFYDTIQETKVSNEHIKNGLARNAKTAAKVASVFTQLAVAQHLYGMAFESMAGYNPAFDIIEVLMTAFGFDDEEDSEDTLKDNLGQGFEALMEDLPYASIVTGGGRIPISSALPIKEFFKGEDQYGNEKNRWETIGEVAPYYLMPGGYGQLKKTTQGLKMFSDDHPIAGSYTDAGNLRYDVEDTVGSRIKAGIFGQYASENAQKYFDQEQRTLNPEQTEIFAGLNIPIEEYWKYRDSYNEFKALNDTVKEAAFADNATDEDILKYAYTDAIYDELNRLYKKQQEIADGNSRGKTLELRQLQKQMEQMISESKYAFGSMKHFGAYAEIGSKRFNYDAKKDKWYEIKSKNSDGSDNWYYQMEQEVTKGLGISYEEYWNNREEYNYAYEKPEKYAMAQAVGGYKPFTEYYDVLKNNWSDNYLRADKDSRGNSISGSRKKKVLEYINGLDIDYGSRLILYKYCYSSEDRYNDDIVDYLNSRDDIDYNEMKYVLEELGAKVDANGNITW